MEKTEELKNSYADLFLFIATSFPTALHSRKELSKKEFNNALDTIMNEIRAEVERSGNVTAFPEPTIKKLKSYGMFLFNEYNRLKEYE